MSLMSFPYLEEDNNESNKKKKQLSCLVADKNHTDPRWRRK